MSEIPKQLSHDETKWEQQQHPLIVACDNWHDPLNVGMLFRLAEAYGVEALWLGGNTPAPPHRKINKTARSTVRNVTHESITDLAVALRDAREKGYLLIGVEITDQSIPIRTYLNQLESQPTVLVLGSENVGISPPILRMLDACVHLPMYGQNTSINVMMATSIAVENWVSWLREG